MVHGIELFREKFKEYTGKYVFIGGTACDIILGNSGAQFRATKDLDIVLIIEAVDGEFISKFLEFVNEAEYEHINKGTGKNQFYRFSKPGNRQYPAMIELFSARPEWLKTIDTRLSPIAVDDSEESLSAILLNDEYYNFLKDGAYVVDGLSVLSLEYIIPFKMKAWLDLSERKENGEQIDSRNISKHRNDVLRLAANLDPGKRVNLPEEIKRDVLLYLGNASTLNGDLKALGYPRVTYKDIIKRIIDCYGLDSLDLE